MQPSSPKNILVCGDAMQDEYWFGEIKRISPEAPVPIVRMSPEIEVRTGAAANVAANCEAMGAPCDRLFSSTSERIRKIRVIAKGHHVARIDFDIPQEPVTRRVFEAMLPEAKVVVFSDYGKGALANVAELIEVARSKAEVPILVDPKGADFERYRGATLIKPNRDELREMVGGWSDRQTLERKAEELRQRVGASYLLVTLSEDGMLLCAQGAAAHIPSVAKEVFDITGAGDTVIAALAVGLYRSMDLYEACELANRAASIAVSRVGTAVVTKEELGID
jgi:D-glycero-beta-D-manno-heptose-7-phosphate kinase